MRAVLLIAALAGCSKSTPTISGPTTYDLGKAGPRWKGYSAQLPRAGAEVMQDRSDGARLATNGRDKDPFDLAWAPGPPDRDVIKGHIAAGPGMKITSDALDGIEWTQEYDPGKLSYHFDLAVSVIGETLHCYSLPMGVASESGLARHKAACKTLTKAPAKP